MCFPLVVGALGGASSLEARVQTAYNVDTPFDKQSVIAGHRCAMAIAFLHSSEVLVSSHSPMRAEGWTQPPLSPWLMLSGAPRVGRMCVHRQRRCMMQAHALNRRALITRTAIKACIPVQVWDRDMWIRTDTSVAVYEDRFRPGEQLYGTCVRATSPKMQERRDLQEQTLRRSTDAAAQHARRTLNKRLRRFWAQQDEYLSAEAAGEVAEPAAPPAELEHDAAAAFDTGAGEPWDGDVWQTR